MFFGSGFAFLPCVTASPSLQLSSLPAGYTSGRMLIVPCCMLFPSLFWFCFVRQSLSSWSFLWKLVHVTLLRSLFRPSASKLPSCWQSLPPREIYPRPPKSVILPFQMSVTWLGSELLCHFLVMRVNPDTSVDCELTFASISELRPKTSCWSAGTWSARSTMLGPWLLCHHGTPGRPLSGFHVVFSRFSGPYTNLSCVGELIAGYHSLAT